MILDALNKVASAQQVTATAVSASAIDLGNVTPRRKIGVGTPMVGVVALKALGTTTGSVKLQVVQSDAVALTTPEVIGELDLALADLALNKVYKIGIGASIPGKRYLGMQFTVTGTVDVTFDGFITTDKDAATIADTYAKGYVI